MRREPTERELALHQITAINASPDKLIRIAAETGCQRVCVFTYIPPSAAGAGFPLITRENIDSVKAAMTETGVGVENIEFFPILSEVPAHTYLDAFALGQEMGARRAVVHIQEPDQAIAVVRLREVADLAAKFHLSLGLEFMGLTPSCNSVERAVWFVEAVGRSNLGIAVDALHLARTGGTPADLLAIPAKLFAYAQICDGHGLQQSADYLSEALDRELPGNGDFPLQAMIEALPRATALDVEVPSARLAASSMAVINHVREAVARSRQLIAAANITR